eukprot:5706586-Karenia_brevis.AAC.1
MGHFGSSSRNLVRVRPQEVFILHSSLHDIVATYWRHFVLIGLRSICNNIFGREKESVNETERIEKNVISFNVALNGERTRGTCSACEGRRPIAGGLL